MVFIGFLAVYLLLYRGFLLLEETALLQSFNFSKLTFFSSSESPHELRLTGGGGRLFHTRLSKAHDVLYWSHIS